VVHAGRARMTVPRGPSRPPGASPVPPIPGCETARAGHAGRRDSCPSRRDTRRVRLPADTDLLAQVGRVFLREDARRPADAEKLYDRLVAEAPILRVVDVWLVSGWPEITALIGDPRLAIGPRAVQPAIRVTRSSLLDDLFCRMLTARDGADHA